MKKIDILFRTTDCEFGYRFFKNRKCHTCLRILNLITNEYIFLKIRYNSIFLLKFPERDSTEVLAYSVKLKCLEKLNNECDEKQEVYHFPIEHKKNKLKDEYPEFFI